MTDPVLAAVAAAGAVLLGGAHRPSVRAVRAELAPVEGADRQAPGALRRWRWPISLLSGVAAALFVSGPLGPVAGCLAAGASYVVIGRSEDPTTRRARLAAEADLPHLVLLLAAGLRSGAPSAAALGVACAALPGGAADRLDGVRARLALGIDPMNVWEPLIADPVLASLARTMTRSTRSGARVADAVEGLSVDLSRQARARREDQARSVGVKAALPLGLCLLPAFLLIGIVPVVAGLFGSLTG